MIYLACDLGAPAGETRHVPLRLSTVNKTGAGSSLVWVPLAAMLHDTGARRMLRKTLFNKHSYVSECLLGDFLFEKLDLLAQSK